MSMPPMSWQSGIVEISGGRLAYHRTGGPGPALVLSHGLTDNGLCWSRFATALAGEFDIIMLDARGHGLSSRICEGDAPDPARDIAEAIDQLGLAAPIVMGHSVGARATAGYANTYPDRVAKVVLEDPPFLPRTDPAALETRRQSFRAQVEGFQAKSAAEIIAMGRSTSPSWHEDEFPAWAAGKRQVDPNAAPTYLTRWQDSILHITAPTLLIIAEPGSGGIVTPEIAREACTLNPNITTAEVKGAGHNIRRENFPDFLAIVQTFLRGQ